MAVTTTQRTGKLWKLLWAISLGIMFVGLLLGFAHEGWKVLTVGICIYLFSRLGMWWFHD